MNSILRFVSVLLALLCVSESYAQRDLMPSNPEVEAFMVKKLPEAAALLQRVERQDGRKAYRQALREVSLDMMDYEETLEFDGAPAASNLLAQIRVDYRLQTHVIDYHRAKKDSPKRKSIREKITVGVEELAKLERQALDFELASVKAMVKEVEGEIAAHETLTPTDLGARVEDLLLGMKLTGPEDKRHLAMIEALPKGWHAEVKAAKAAAAQSQKPILLLVSAAWCEPCRELVRKVLPKEELSKQLDAFERVYIETDLQPDLTNHYRIRAVPTLLMIDGKGAVKDKLVGYADAKTLASWLGQKRPK